MELYIIIIAVIVAVGILISSIMNAKSANKNINGIIIMALAGACAVIFMLFGFMFSSFAVYLLFIVLVAVLLLMVFLLMQFVRNKKEKNARAYANGNTGGNARKLGVRVREVSGDRGNSYPDDLLQKYFAENETREASAAPVAEVLEADVSETEADENQSAAELAETPEADEPMEDNTDGKVGQPAISYEFAENITQEVEEQAEPAEDKIAFVFAAESEEPARETIHAELPSDIAAEAEEIQEITEETSAMDSIPVETWQPEAETFEEAAEEPEAGIETEEAQAEDEAEKIQEAAEEEPIAAPESYSAPEESEKERTILKKADGLKEQGKYLVAYGLFQSAAQNAQNQENMKYAEFQMLDCLVLAGQTEDACRVVFGILNKKYVLTSDEKQKLKDTMSVLHNADRQKTV